ncbi:MAG: non-ribosomal peptide synthetase, partial [Alphaproteobacteria bacterium]|nr:non-ribosomal peptide synthetase [Alphaproteobacteria bacterium]
MNKKKIQSIYSLSPIQSGLLFQTLFSPESDTYFVQSIFELEGEIDVLALRSAWQIVSDHHPILRTGFVWHDGKSPLQYVLESAEVPFTIEDWQSLREQKQEEKLEAFIQEDRKRGFDLSKAPLFRHSLIQYAKDKHYLIWSQHHILTDGWCWPIILGDVFKAYADIKKGKDVHLKTPRPYQDYIAWLQKQDLNKAEVFWKDYLSSLEEPTRLSFKDIIKENKEKDYDTYSIAFSPEETEKIKIFTQQHGLTLNTIIQGAVGVVLKTYTQQQDIVMGVTISGRSIDLPGVEEMVGLFINTLPLRMTYIPGETCLSFLKNLQKEAQKLNDYSYTPLAQVQSWAQTGGSLFDVIFVFENYPLDGSDHTQGTNFIIKGIRRIDVKTEYPLTISIDPGNQLNLILNYQTAHFNEETIKRFCEHIRQILQNFLLNTDKSLLRTQEISLLTSQEEHQLLIEWNNTKVEYPEVRGK